ncbi:MAG: hypothetical protein M1828_002520 [Chrysothrix sp. TS-e1954]|nr:MAG: hypothetical protein M1828_002520 [Chrysothrix sp. TS-e1954]
MVSLAVIVERKNSMSIVIKTLNIPTKVREKINTELRLVDTRIRQGEHGNLRCSRSLKQRQCNLYRNLPGTGAKWASRPLGVRRHAKLDQSDALWLMRSPAVQAFAIHIDASQLERKWSREKGVGTFARGSIGEYTRIIDEHPLINLHGNEDLLEAFEQFQNLSDKTQQQLLELHKYANAERDDVLADKLRRKNIAESKIPMMVNVSSAFTANAFNVEDPGSPGGVRRALFPTISRINHSCMPNAHTYYDPLSGKMTCHTLSGIQPGEEILISYFSILLTRQKRQERAATWKFVCKCPACEGGSLTERTRSDLQVMRAEHDVVTNKSVDAQQAQNHVHRMNEMLKTVSDDKWLRPQLPIAYDQMASSFMMLFEATNELSLLQSIQENLVNSTTAEANIIGTESFATSKRREKLQAFEKVAKQIEVEG